MKRAGALGIAASCVLLQGAACGSSDDAKAVKPHVSPNGGEGGEAPTQIGGAASTPVAVGGAGGEGASTEGAGSDAGGAGAGPRDAGEPNGGAGGDGSMPCLGPDCPCLTRIVGSGVLRDDGNLLLIQNGVTTPIRSSVTDAPLDGVASAWIGQYVGCASRTDGSVWCWGTSTDANTQGLFGTGTGVPSVTPFSAYRVQVSPGKQDGPVYLAGVRNVQNGLNGGSSAAACALTQGGGVYCWGRKTDGNLTQTGKDESYAVPILDKPDTPIASAQELVVGYRHACYANAAGEVYCWGMNLNGMLGDGSEKDSLYPVQVKMLNGVAMLSAGVDYTCALLGSGADAGRVACWGSSAFGVLGIGAPASNTDCAGLCKLTPTRVHTGPSTFLEDVVAIASGDQLSCALRSDHSLWCWGATGDYASAFQAPAGQPVRDVAGLAVPSAFEPRVLYQTNDYGIVRLNHTSDLIDLSCGPLD